MGLPSFPNPVKLFVGMIAPDPQLFDLAAKRLRADYGPIDLESPCWPWHYTQYYARELGDRLLRKFIFFEQGIAPDQLAAIKRTTIKFEQQTGKNVHGQFHRSVNLDPGYLTDAKVVLATTKDFAHRIYLQDGIYAEVTLIYRAKGFQPCPFTYPDFRARPYLDLFNQARTLYRQSSQRLP